MSMQDLSRRLQTLERAWELIGEVAVSFPGTPEGRQLNNQGILLCQQVRLYQEAIQKASKGTERRNPREYR